MEMSVALTKVLPRKWPGFALYICKIERAVNEKIVGCGGKQQCFLPTNSLHRVGLIEGICWTKSQSPRYSLGLWGPWLQMTSVLLKTLNGSLNCIQYNKILISISTHWP